MEESIHLLQIYCANRPLLRDVLAVFDWGCLPCAHYVNVNLQHADYDGYTQNVEVKHLLILKIRGGVIHAGLNFPDLWQDRKIVYQYGQYSLMFKYLDDDRTPPGYAFQGDRAFVIDSSITSWKSFRAKKLNEKFLHKNQARAGAELALQRVMPSKTRSMEWRIRALKGSSGSLRLPLMHDSKRRAHMLANCEHLLGSRTQKAGLSQKRTVYACPEKNMQPTTKRLIQEQDYIYFNKNHIAY